MEVSVEATPITPFLEPETPAVPQKIPQPLPSFTGTVYFVGKGYDQTGEVYFVRTTDWTGPRQAELPPIRHVLKIQDHKENWAGEHWKQPGKTICSIGCQTCRGWS